MSLMELAADLTGMTLDVLPSPFAWVPVSAGHVTLRVDAGSFNTSPFLLAKYPITYTQYQVFIDIDDGYYADAWWDGLAVDKQIRTQPCQQKWQIPDHPREHVSWHESIAFCRWLSTRLDTPIRLPTEVEWQRAAQGDDGRKYPWGNDFNRELCNTKENGIYQTTPVDSYPAGASPFGVLDMVGNVWEWCLNPYDDPISQDVTSTLNRAMRGGTYGYDRSYGNITYREQGDPNGRYISDGFRIAATP